VLKSFLLLSPATTADLATPRWGFSTTVIESLSQQRAEAIVGAGALTVALALGIVSILLASSSGAVILSRGSAIAVAAGTTIVAVVAMQVLSASLSLSHTTRSKHALMTARLDGVLKEGRFEKAFVEDLTQSAKVLLGLDLDPARGPRHVVTTIATTLGRPLPNALNIPEQSP